MELFDRHLGQVSRFLDQKSCENRVIDATSLQGTPWPRLDSKPLVLMPDTAVELGHPQTASTASLLWTNGDQWVKNRRISIVGQELCDIKEGHSPFGKIVLIQGDRFDEKNSYDRYRALEQVRYRLFLKGYMMRGASQLQREWSRVSFDAIKSGFSLQTLGSELIDDYLSLDFVRSVQIIFITSSREDVLEMSRITADAMKIIGAMNKMSKEMSFDCDACEYVDVCSEVAALRRMRHQKNAKGKTQCQIPNKPV